MRPRARAWHRWGQPDGAAGRRRVGAGALRRPTEKARQRKREEPGVGRQMARARGAERTGVGRQTGGRRPSVADGWGGGQAPTRAAGATGRGVAVGLAVPALDLTQHLGAVALRREVSTALAARRCGAAVGVGVDAAVAVADRGEREVEVDALPPQRRHARAAVEAHHPAQRGAPKAVHTPLATAQGASGRARSAGSAGKWAALAATGAAAGPCSGP